MHDASSIRTTKQRLLSLTNKFTSAYELLCVSIPINFGMMKQLNLIQCWKYDLRSRSFIGVLQCQALIIFATAQIYGAS